MTTRLTSVAMREAKIFPGIFKFYIGIFPYPFKLTPY